MMLKFREDKIQRMESLLGGLMSADDYLMEENNALSAEVQVLRSQIDKNPEVTRFAAENIRLLNEVRRFQDFYEEGEKDMLMKELSELRTQLVSFLDGNSKNPNDFGKKETNQGGADNGLLHKELKITLFELENSKTELSYCLEENAKFRRELEKLHASSNVTTNLAQDLDCSAEFIKEPIVEVPFSSNLSTWDTPREKEGTWYGNLTRSAENLMDLQLELDIIKVIQQEERSYHSEQEEMFKSLNTDLQLSKERLTLVTKEYENVQEELKNVKLVVEARELEQLQSINEIEDLRNCNARYEEMLKEKELEISYLKEKAPCREFKDPSLYKSLEDEYSLLEAKLKKMHESLEKDRKLKNWYQNDLAFQASHAAEMETARQQVESETAEVIVYLQEELSGLQQEVQVRKMKEMETRDRLVQLQTQMKIMEDTLHLKSEDTAKLVEMLEDKENQLRALTAEWDLITREIEGILGEGSEALKDVADQADVNSSSLPHKRSLFSEQFGRMQQHVIEKELLIEELNRCLKDAIDREDEVEHMLRSLRGAALVTTETHQQECSEKDQEIHRLTSDLKYATSTIADLHSLIKYAEDQLKISSSCATAAFVIVNRLSELNCNYLDALNDKEVQIKEFSDIITQKNISLDNQTSVLEELQSQMDTLRSEKEESERCERKRELLINQAVLLQEAIGDFEGEFELLVNAMDDKVRRMEDIVHESLSSWLQQKELLEVEHDDAIVVAAQKTIETSCILEKFEEVQDTVREADLIINELVMANEALKFSSNESKLKENELISERNILLQEIQSLKLSNHLKDQDYMKLEKQCLTDFVIMKRMLLELEDLISDVQTAWMEKRVSIVSDFLSLKSQLHESTYLIRKLLEEVWSKVIGNDCSGLVLHLCHMGVLLEAPNGLNEENSLLHHGLCESYSMTSKLTEQNLKSRRDLEMCRVLKGNLLVDIKKGFDFISSKVDEDGEITLKLTSFERKMQDLQFQEEVMLQRSNDIGSELAMLMKELDLINKYTLESLLDQERLPKEKDELFQYHEENLKIELYTKEFKLLILSTELNQMFLLKADLENRHNCTLEVLENFKKDIVFKNIDAASTELIILDKESRHEKIVEELEMKVSALGTSSRHISVLYQQIECMQNDICLLETESRRLHMELEKKDEELGRRSCLEKENEILRLHLNNCNAENNLLLQELVDKKREFEFSIGGTHELAVENQRLRDNVSELENSIAKLDKDLSLARVEIRNLELYQSEVKDDLCLVIPELERQLGNAKVLEEENIFLKNELRLKEVTKFECLNAMNLKMLKNIDFVKNIDDASRNMLNLIEEKFVEADNILHKMVNEMERTDKLLDQFEYVENLAIMKLDSGILSLQNGVVKKG